ncbi:hypothetical protein PP422_gp187 [Enterobacter phage vB_EhoM-IME523]|uniref:Uncharacterized protein n=1 Tax=Enterobacter phage vB_EhoM-IME523 TaxID=2596709 RepID=A0A7G3KBA3_9CAUD|nr:hypothetical protein PP422_gp187 [Enterobacter phage vB_EhoM-IME523]QEA10727.1 hypothetical protein [Enterobacter phage vB_EhoM-IME523]
MITLVEWRNNRGELEVEKIFLGVKPQILKDAVEEAYCASEGECNHPMVCITLYDEDGEFIDSDAFSKEITAFEWWEEKCSN